MRISSTYHSLADIISLGEKEIDKDEKLDPTVTYLQKLGPEYLPLILGGAKWVLSHDHDKGFQVCELSQ